MATVMVDEDGIIDGPNGVQTECYMIFHGTSGPYFLPVDEEVSYSNDDSAEDGSNDLPSTAIVRPAYALDTGGQIKVEKAPIEDNEVLRKVDFSDGSLEALILGFGGTKYWKLYVDPSTHDLVISASQDNGATYNERIRFELINS